MPTAASLLLVVDVQRCFLNAWTEHIPCRVARLVDDGGYDDILFTRFENTAGSPYRRILDWHDCGERPATDIAPPLHRLVREDNVFAKAGFTGIPKGLAALLKDLQPEHIDIVGIDTDMCVLKVAMDIFDHGIRAVVLADGCASTAGLQAHLAGLAVLARNIGAHNLRLAGVHDGHLGRPASGE